MVEHLLLMSFAPPLLLLGYPVVPLLRGLPCGVRIHVLGPLIRIKWLRDLCYLLITPLVAWLAMNLVFLGWHVPAAYDFALEHERWHEIEHLCFLGTSILFWWPVIRPWPTRQNFAGWLLLLYLVLADIVNTVLSAFLPAFCDRPVYGYYLREPNAFHISPLSDERAGAVVMWVIGSLIFLRGPGHRAYFQASLATEGTASDLVCGFCLGFLRIEGCEALFKRCSATLLATPAGGLLESTRCCLSSICRHGCGRSLRSVTIPLWWELPFWRTASGFGMRWMQTILRRSIM